jgi:hypothetical protein
VFLWEVDCAQGRSRLLQATVYAGQKATGMALRQLTGTTPWQFPVPGTLKARREREICQLSTASPR